MRRTTLFASCCVLFFGQIAVAQRIIRVGQGPGYDHSTIQAAIDAATTGDQIWVTQGTYRESIALRDEVALYGGFAGTETRPAERDFAAHRTIIDAQGAGRVVVLHEMRGARIDGFLITGGQAVDGGGIQCVGIDYSNLIANCTIVGNAATRRGGGIDLLASDPVIINCTISGNAALYGAGVCCAGDSLWGAGDAAPFLINCLISGNQAEEGGGAVQGGGERNGHNTAIVNCTIAGNSASFGGGVNHAIGYLTNTIFQGNENYAFVDVGGGAMRSTPTYCLFFDNPHGDLLLDRTSHTGADSINQNLPGAHDNVDGDPLFVIGPRGTWTEPPYYDPATRRTVLTDRAAAFAPGSLAGRLVKPNTVQCRQAWIASNTETTLEVLGDVTGFATQGAPYLVVDYHLHARSGAIDRGTNMDAPSVDIEGAPRPIDVPGQGADGTGMEYDIGAYESSGELRLPNLGFASWEFGPGAPIQIRPGDPLALAAFVQNVGKEPSGPFWLEFWGSRTGGLTLDVYLTDSARLGPLAVGNGHSFVEPRPLYSIADGPYTVVFVLDRPNEVWEQQELDNRAVVAGQRLLTLRPPTNADLAIEGFTFAPDPAVSGKAVTLGGLVRNTGAQDSGPFWIEFWGSKDRLYPNLDFFLCESIGVPNLAPDAALDLSLETRTLYPCPSGTFMAGVFIDRLDQVNEVDETNNYVFLDGIVLNAAASLGVTSGKREDGSRRRERQGAAQDAAADLVVAGGDFSPAAPVQAAPGAPLDLAVRVENRGTTPSAPCWLEFWGSRLGGLTLDALVAESAPVPSLSAGEGLDIAVVRSLYSIADGPYTITFVVDRPDHVAESSEGNNRFAVGGKRLLTVRPMTQANVVLEAFSFGPDPIHKGEPIALGGRARNLGTEDSGPFWIEFWGSHNQNEPRFDFFLCDSIGVANLAAGASVDLSAHARTMYVGVPEGEFAVFCFADRSDLVNETNEADNYTILRGCRVVP